MHHGRWLLCLALASCSSDPETPPDPSDAGAGRDAGGPASDAGAPDAGPRPACDPALSVDPASAAVLPLDLYTVRATGGTGAYRFSLETNASGAIVNALSGAYLSGETEGVTDVVRVEDEGCAGDARVEIEVVRGLELRPSEVRAVPGTAFTFEVEGGSGNFSFTSILAGSGGEISVSGAYAAGPNDGVDRVEVVDLETGESREATVTIDASTRMAPVPPVVFVPVGETFELAFTGGSGYVEIEGQPASFDLVEGRAVRGRVPGRDTVRLLDRFTGQSSDLEVTVVAPQSFSPLAAGDALFASRIIGPGDLDGDGRPDAILAHPEADVGALDAGAVFVYRGGAVGLDPAPAQILSGGDRDDELGRAVTVGDFDGDGHLDLAIGAPRADAAGGDTGVLRIHRGLEGGFFAPEPALTLSGRFGGDLFGWSVASCDFDGDGRLDLAVGAYNAEDRDRSDVASNQGGVFVFLGHDAGFRDTPNQVLWGDLPAEAGGFAGERDLHYGEALAAGDVDGDGLCDLAVGSFEYDGGSSNVGLVQVHRGVAGSDSGPGGLSPRPALAFANADADREGQLGRNLTVGDLDGDGRAEIVVSHHRFDAGDGDDHGAVRVYRGRALSGPVERLAPAVPADWEVAPADSGDQWGFSVRVADATGDGAPDLLVGSIAHEIQGGPGNAGTVSVFAGRAGMLPDPMPVRIFTGASGGDYLGATVDVLGDPDGDGRPEIVAFAQLADRLGRDSGEPLLFYGNDEVPAVPLDIPAEPSGMRFGWDAAVVGDVDGDGVEDLVVTAPESAVADLGRLSGEAYLYRGAADGFEAEPALVLSGMRRHSGFDRLGYGVAPAGDFDGDGRPDFALTVRFDDLPGSFGDAYAPEPSCTDGRSNVGAVYVFRGSAAGLPSPEPAFVYYGPVPGDGLRTLAGGFDYDGDGYDDLIAGNEDFDRSPDFNMGGFVLVRGRPADAERRTVVICEPDFQLLGQGGNDRLGHAVAGVGDLDGDGCDEVAAGAPFADPMERDEGAVVILFGWGGPGCPASPEMVALRSGARLAQGGHGLGGGGDVDGDGVPDLAVGLPDFRADADAVGAAGVVLGSHVLAQPREPAASAPGRFAPMFPSSRTLVLGRRPGEDLGFDVALLPLGGGRAALAAGSPRGDLAGTIEGGGAQVFRWSGGGLDPQPWAGFAGEPGRPGGRLGDLVRAGTRAGRPVLMVGGYLGTSVTLDGGSLYALDLP